MNDTEKKKLHLKVRIVKLNLVQEMTMKQARRIFLKHQEV